MFKTDYSCLYFFINAGNRLTTINMYAYNNTSMVVDVTDKEMRVLNKDYKDFALIMKALGDENRIKIFDMLSQGERCACKILEEFSITQSTLSYHMKILCDSGLVKGRRDGIWMHYTINPDTLELVKDFFDRIDPSVIAIAIDADADAGCCKGD